MKLTPEQRFEIFTAALNGAIISGKGQPLNIIVAEASRITAEAISKVENTDVLFPERRSSAA